MPRAEITDTCDPMASATAMDATRYMRLGQQAFVKEVLLVLCPECIKLDPRLAGLGSVQFVNDLFQR